MAKKLDPSFFHPYNVTDTCSIWNILSAEKLYKAATSVAAKCYFCCTRFVYYECLVKPRSNETQEEKELRRRLTFERKTNGQFKDYHIDIEDLQEIEILKKRKNLDKGELSSIVFAKKTGQAFLTDERDARSLAEQVMDEGMVQTTPHLLGWLFYHRILTDSDKDLIIEEHSKFRREKRGNLSKFFKIMYKRACEYRLMNRSV